MEARLLNNLLEIILVLNSILNTGHYLLGNLLLTTLAGWFAEGSPLLSMLAELFAGHAHWVVCWA